MRKFYIVILVFIFSINSFSQILFEKGYFIDNSGNKTECFIKNMDWKDNPLEFEYKLTENDDVKIADIEFVKEFGVNSVSKYIRVIVDIDKSSNEIQKLSDKKQPIYSKEKVFLNVIIEGEASLYDYEHGNFKRYFYKVDTSRIEQLIYKKYKVDVLKVGENTRFKQQLWSDLKCESISLANIKGVNYNKKDLYKLFEIYNESKNYKYTSFNNKADLDLFNLSVKLGVRNSTLEISNGLSSNSGISLDTNFDNETSFSVGLEAELILPFNKNKWSVFVEPTYQYYKSAKEITYLEAGVNTRKTSVTVDYKSIEVPIGIRHYLFLNEKSKLFVNLLYTFDVPMPSTIKTGNASLFDLDIESQNNFVIGAGFNFNNRYNLELRYGMSRALLNNYVSWSSDYKSISLIFGYNIF